LDYYLHDDPRLPLAWAPWFSHEYITYFSVQAVDKIMALPQVKVEHQPDFGSIQWPMGPKHINLYKESYREYRQLPLFDSYSYAERNGEYSIAPPENLTIEPWKILVIYSTEPDLNPDCDLNLHQNQKFTGGSHGWRHMQFRALGKKFGIATESVRLHMVLARMAFEQGNDYWGWRYLSRCTHYLADLGNPFHVYAVPTRFLIKNIFASSKLFRIVSSAHQGYEIYAQHRFREGFPAFKEALLKGALEGQTMRHDVNEGMNAYMHQAEKQMESIFYFFIDEFGKELSDVFRQMDQYRHLDAAAQTNLCSKDAAAVIFQESHMPSLNFLDQVTVDILFNVGKMLGSLVAGFHHGGRK
jgi:hypothetical protein